MRVSDGWVGVCGVLHASGGVWVIVWSGISEVVRLISAIRHDITCVHMTRRVPFPRLRRRLRED